MTDKMVEAYLKALESEERQNRNCAQRQNPHDPTVVKTLPQAAQVRRAAKTASGAIFRAKSGKSMSRYQIWPKMKKLCTRAGVDAGEVFPHNLRHLFATAFYRAYKEIVKLADVLGHSSIETTRIYLVTSMAEHRRQLEQLKLVS